MLMVPLMGKMIGAGHIGLMVSDMAASVAFYRDLLRMSILYHNCIQDEKNNKTVTINFFQLGSLVIEAIDVPGLEVGTGGRIDHIAIAVEDIESVKAELEQKGIAFNGEIVFDPGIGSNGCKYATFHGPDGENLEINEIL